jgi:hypothetical protein
MTVPGSPGKGTTKSHKESKEDGGSNKKGNWQQRSGKPVTIPRQHKFEGKCDDLKGHIYDCTDSRQADQYTKTTKEIQEYVGRTFKGGGDACLIFDNLTLPVIPEPDDSPAGAGKTKCCIWEKQVNEYVKQVSLLKQNIKTIYSLV